MQVQVETKSNALTYLLAIAYLHYSSSIFTMKKTEHDALESQKKTKQNVLESQKAHTMLPAFHCQFRLEKNL